METTHIYAILATLITSLISLIGVITLSIRIDLLKKILIYMISLSAWALLWDVFIHLLPELIEKHWFWINISLWIIWWIIISFILEKVIHWRHCHHPTTDEHPHSLAIMNLFWDALHNYLDWLIIWWAFLIDVHVWIATTIAVILHEIPQEIWDFGILVHAWYSINKALFFNFLISLTALLGVITALALNSIVENLYEILIPITVWVFIYIASADLIPEMHKKSDIKSSILQLIVFMLWVWAMMMLLLLEWVYYDQHIKTPINVLI